MYKSDEEMLIPGYFLLHKKIFDLHHQSFLIEIFYMLFLMASNTRLVVDSFVLLYINLITSQTNSSDQVSSLLLQQNVDPTIETKISN